MGGTYKPRGGELVATSNTKIEMTVPYCRECGTDTRTMGFVNRVPSDIEIGNDTFLVELDCYICGPCIDTWDAEDIIKDGKVVYCPMRDEDENYPDVDHEDLEDHGYYRESCDNAEIAHKDYWYPEVDKCQPHAKALRDAIEADDGKATWELLLIMLREA